MLQCAIYWALLMRVKDTEERVSDCCSVFAVCVQCVSQCACSVFAVYLQNVCRVFAECYNCVCCVFAVSFNVCCNVLQCGVHWG